MKYQFHLTCPACPEQYDVMDGHHIVAYVRYRHGLLTVNPVLPKWETRRWTADDRERTEQVCDYGTDIICETLGDMWDGRKFFTFHSSLLPYRAKFLTLGNAQTRLALLSLNRNIHLNYDHHERKNPL